MPKKKDKLTNRVLDIVSAGTTLSIGSLVVGSVGATGGPQTRQLAASVQRGFGVAAAGLPTIAGVSLLKELEKARKR